MRNMIKVRCYHQGFSDSGDWKTEERLDDWGGHSYMLCSKEANQWWEIEGEEAIDVKISTYSTKSSYLCQLTEVHKWGGAETRLRIKAESNGRWKRYEIYDEFCVIVEKFLDERGMKKTDHFYLGVDIVQ